MGNVTTTKVRQREKNIEAAAFYQRSPSLDTGTESTKRSDPGIQHPEEGFTKRGGLKPQRLMRQSQGLMSQPQKIIRKFQPHTSKVNKVENS